MVPTRSGREVAIDVAGRTIQAWVPATLAERDLSIAEATVRLAAGATGSILRADDRLSPQLDTVGRLLRRSEAVASSNIEGLSANLGDVLIASIDERLADPTSAWIADNLAVIDDCLEHARSSRRLTMSEAHAWHERLMLHGELSDDLVGALRDRPGWVGGTSPTTAAYIPPPPDELRRLMEDLLRWSNSKRDDPVVQAAVAHAQFETIHPYGDGNGRVGRLLVTWILARRLGVTPPPASAFVQSDIGGYLAGLTLFRSGPIDRWVRWFAEVLDRAALGTIDWAGRVADLVSAWERDVSDLRSDAAARRLVPRLPASPLVSARIVADMLDVSAESAHGALEVLGARGILAPFEPVGRRPGRPTRWLLAKELLALRL